MSLIANNKRWTIKPPAPEEFFGALRNTNKYEFTNNKKLFGQLLWNRGLKTQEEIDRFLNPDYEKRVYDPFLFKGMEKAVERLIRAVKNREKIIVFSDYDADGICGAAVMSEFLKKIEADFEVFIPDRFKEQYGLSLERVDEFKALGAKLIITIDCGVTDFDEIERARNYGIDTIVLDHHIVPPKWPNAVAIIDHKQEDDMYPEKILSGAALVYKFVQAVLSRENFGILRGWEKWFLDVVAIAAVADMVPLLGENRVFVKYGLDVLKKMRRIGLRALLRLKEIKPEDITAETIGFIISPRLNAASRMAQATDAFELLMTDNQMEADWLANHLEEKNNERKELVEIIFKNIDEKLRGIENPAIIFESSRDWPAGVLGIAANRLLEKYHCPVFLASEMADAVKGSCRAPEGTDLVEMMKKFGDLFSDFGGHKLSGGFTVSLAKLAELKLRLSELAKSFSYNKECPAYEAEAKIGLGEVNAETYELLKEFEPFGKENPKPLFLIKNLEIKELRHVGADQNHVKMKLLALRSPAIRGEGGGEVLAPRSFSEGVPALRSPGEGVGAIYFRGSHNGFKQGDRIDVLAEMQENKWNSNTAIELNIVDAVKL